MRAFCFFLSDRNFGAESAADFAAELKGRLTVPLTCSVELNADLESGFWNLDLAHASHLAASHTILDAPTQIDETV